MKKSTMILIGFIAIIFTIQFSMIFQINSKINHIESITNTTLEKQALSKVINSIEVQDNIISYVLQDNENWIETNDTIFSQEIKNNHLCITENTAAPKSNIRRNRPPLTIAIQSLNNIIIKNNAKLSVKEGMLSDTLEITAFNNSKINLSDIEAKFVSIRCEDNSYVKIADLTCDGLQIFASNNSRVKIQGNINYAKGKVKNNASVKIPSVGKSDFSKEDNASFSMYQ